MRWPSALVTMVGLPPSMAATAELVVPRSMPTTFSAAASTLRPERRARPQARALLWVRETGVVRGQEGNCRGSGRAMRERRAGRTHRQRAPGAQPWPPWRTRGRPRRSPCSACLWLPETHGARVVSSWDGPGAHPSGMRGHLPAAAAAARLACAAVALWEGPALEGEGNSARQACGAPSAAGRVSRRISSGPAVDHLHDVGAAHELARQLNNPSIDARPDWPRRAARGGDAQTPKADDTAVCGERWCIGDSFE